MPGSPAFNYLSYFSKATSSGNWAPYESKGLVIPTLAPGAIAFTGEGALPAQVATVVAAGSSAATAYTMQYDPYGKHPKPFKTPILIAPQRLSAIH